jgi:hypothetical protein
VILFIFKRFTHNNRAAGGPDPFIKIAGIKSRILGYFLKGLGHEMDWSFVDIHR